jgi:phage terminase large subunit-like protein
VRCSTRDNPFAPPEFADRISQNYSTALALQEIEGDFVEISGLIFKREWFLNVVRHAPANATRVRYVDKASSADSGCYTVGLLMARDDRGIYYIEEMIRGQWSAHVRNQMLLEMCRKDSIKYGGTVLTYIEQEGGGDGKTVSEQLITMLSQFPVYRDVVSGGQWKKKGNERLPGDAKVRRALPFAAQCEAGNVRLVEGSFHGDFLDEVTMFPEYAYADIVDACVIAGTQIATENGSKPIENVLPGDRVLTRGGFKEVLWSGQTGVSVDTVLIECHNGSVLQLTGNHPVYVVGKKWVQASRINAGDRVLVSTRRKSSRSTDTASGDTRSIIESTYKTTSGGESMERQKASIGTRGKRITGQFPTGTRCTTLTAIHSTTQSTILSACRCPSTQRSTRGEAILSGQNRTLKEFDHSRRSGTDHQRVANGIASMPHELSRTEKQQRKHAQRAARRLSPCTPTLSAVQRFALTGSESIPTAQSAIVTFARTATKRLTQERRSRSIAVAHVVRVRFMQHGEPVNVFNLSVSECEEYFANGILVHNCSGAYNALQRLAPTYGDVAQRSTEPMPKSRFGQTAHLGEGNSISQWSELPWNQNTEPTDELMGR